MRFLTTARSSYRSLLRIHHRQYSSGGAAMSTEEDKLFLDFAIADQILTRRVIIQLKDQSITTDFFKTLCSGQVKTKDDVKIGLRGAPLARDQNVSGIQCNFDHDVNLLRIDSFLTNLTTSPPNKGLQLPEFSEGSVVAGVNENTNQFEFRINTATSSTIDGDDNNRDKRTEETCRSDVVGDQAASHFTPIGAIVYGMKNVRQIELSALANGSLEHVSIANCGVWSPNIDNRPGEKSEGSSGGEGVYGYTLYE